MTQASKVLGFLDVTGHWDPSLVFVMGGAVVTHFALLRLFRAQSKPIFADIFYAPLASAIDRRLLVGAVLFGIGWGMGGFCPGPAIVSVAGAAPPVVVTVACMTLSSFAVRKWLSPARTRDES